MLKKIENLIDLKSLITILLVVGLLSIIFLNIQIPDESIKTLFVSVTSSVFTYYFTRKSEEKNTAFNENTKEGA